MSLTLRTLPSLGSTPYLKITSRGGSRNFQRGRGGGIPSHNFARAFRAQEFLLQIFGQNYLPRPLNQRLSIRRGFFLFLKVSDYNPPPRAIAAWRVSDQSSGRRVDVVYKTPPPRAARAERRATSVELDMDLRKDYLI